MIITYLTHQLSIFGIRNFSLSEISTPHAKKMLRLNWENNPPPSSSNINSIYIVFKPNSDFYLDLGIQSQSQKYSLASFEDAFIKNSHKSWDLRTLHSYLSYNFPATIKCTPFLRNYSKQPVWFSFSHNDRNYLIIGTSLIEDLILFRQGDPTQVFSDVSKTAWGFEFERPVYLYEKLRDMTNALARPADSWMLLLREIFDVFYKVPVQPILPNNAKGAVIITGDDDQAYLENYKKQLQCLQKIPITYFMHPQTKMSSRFAKKITAEHFVDFGLHPDALDSPTDYNWLCAKQTFWFIRHFKRFPFSVRNHGFLNNGYWGHLRVWNLLNLKFSSNLPGYDGNILTGSLLPSRVVYNGNCSQHWSLLCTFGDGMVFSDKYTDDTAAKKIYSFAEDLIASKMPGIIVFNLHPQNFECTKKIHNAVIEIVESGFYPFTMRSCFDWFNERKKLLWDCVL